MKKTGFLIAQVFIAAGLVGILALGGFFLANRYDTSDIAVPDESNDSSTLNVLAPGFEDTKEIVVQEQSAKDESFENESEPYIPPPREESTEFVISEESPEESGDYQVQEVSIPPVESTEAVVVLWNKTLNGWEPSRTPPVCQSPLLLATPVDLSLTTSVLYPGQYRGNQYKPHGGFRFDTSESDEITVTAPLDGQVVDGARYLVDGEIQYTFDIINSCGIWYRFGHMRKLSPKFLALAETFPEAIEGDSRTHSVKGVSVVTGEIVATAVGLADDNNVFVDWGVYDLRSKNSASEDVAWATVHENDQEQHAVCWFDLLTSVDEGVVRGLLAADGKSGKTSDYCE